MVSGPPEIDVGLWVGTQVTCPGARLHHGTSGGTSRLSALASAVPRLPAGKTGPAVSFPYLTQRQWYFLASFSWFCFFLDSCWNGPPRSQHQPPAHSWCSCAAGMAAAGCPLGRMERWPVPGEVARTDYLLQAINCRPSLSPVPLYPRPFSAVNSPFPFQNSSGASGLCFSSTCSYLPPTSPHWLSQRRLFRVSLFAACCCLWARLVALV